MKKSLIAVAVAGLFAAPVAMADVTISGAINMGLQYGDSNGTGAFSNTALNANYSHIDIESTDDIGGGNKVVFHYQFDFSNTGQAAYGTTSTAGRATNRNSFLGIVGDWGAVKYGTNENVYERLQYSTDFMDGAAGPGGNLLILGTASSATGASTVFENGQGACGAAAGGCMGFYRRSEHTVWYESPNWNGFNFEVDYTLSAFKTGGATGTDPKILSIGGKYQPEGMPFFVDVGYEKHDDMFGMNAVTGQVTGTGSSDDGFQIGAGYMFGDFQINARWERLTYETDGTTVGEIQDWERDAMFFGGKWNLPTGFAAVQLGIADEGDCTMNGGGACTAGNDTGATMFAIGYFHNLSKQSQIQAIYNQTDNDSNAQYYSIGGTTVAAGNDHKGIYLGIKHTF